MHCGAVVRDCPTPINIKGCGLFCKYRLGVVRCVCLRLPVEPGKKLAYGLKPVHGINPYAVLHRQACMASVACFRCSLYYDDAQLLGHAAFSLFQQLVDL